MKNVWYFTWPEYLVVHCLLKVGHSGLNISILVYELSRLDYFRFWKYFCQMCEKLGHFQAHTAFRNHTCSSAYVPPVQKGICRIEDKR